EPYPLSSACSDEWHGWSIVIFGNFLFIYNSSAIVLFDINREDNTLCGLYLTSSKDKSPVEFRGEMEVTNPSIGGFRYQMLYLTRQLMASRNFDLTNEVIQQWSDFYVEEPTTQRKRPQSLCRRRLDAHSNHRRRATSAPPRSKPLVPGKEFEEYTRIRTDLWKMSKQLGVVRAGNLLLDIVETESDLLLLRVRPKGAGDDVFLFSSRQNQGFFKLRACYGLATILHESIDPPSEAEGPTPTIIGMDDRFWLINSSSGPIQEDLFAEDVQKNFEAPVGEKQLVRFKMHYLASRMLSHDLASMASPDSAKPLPSAPPKGMITKGKTLDGADSIVDTIVALCEIAACLGNAPYRTSRQEALDDLNEGFSHLLEIFSTGEEAVTPYELSSSGLVSSLLLCLSSSSCIHWSGVVSSNNSRLHMEFLQQRRQTFLRICEGKAGLSTLVRCLVNVLDQTERLPIHIFEEISYPTSSDQLKHGVSACMEALSAASPPAGATSESTEEEYSQVLPLGLIAPPLPSSSGYHNHLTGGGVRGLVDRQVLLLLGAWFPDLNKRVCTGTVGTSQVQDTFTMTVKRRLNAPREIRVGSGKGRPLFLSHGFPRGRPFFMPSSTEFWFRGVTLVKEWYQCPRKSMRFLREFWKRPHYTVSLTPEITTSTLKASGVVELQMGLLEWMGTCGGTVETWVNPCKCGLVAASIFQPSSNSFNDGSLALEQGVTASEASPLDDATVDEEELNSFDKCILNGEEVGARLTIEIGVQLMPTAYRLSTLLNEQSGVPIRNWCLQGSNDGRYWTTLSVHKDTIPLNQSPVIVPLSVQDFRFWSRPLSGDVNTSTLTRPLSTEAASDASVPLEVASVSTPEGGTKESEVDLSFHIFRIMDLTTLSKQSNLIVKGFELFGSVTFVHPSVSKLL
ncbi:unnamed protein product, partial [Hydatigera taeniaeformis]|uniref:E3 ubiquitin-protein ligase n=1 Tax=Hydatigena taeniaeformis TaxID=6205 RepID=A0A0R3XAN9_HYDTA